MRITRIGERFIDALGPPADCSGEEISGLHLSVVDAARGVHNIGVDQDCRR
jgi:hypothetical protein